MRLDVRKNEIVKFTESGRECRQIKLPRLGTISFKDYDLPDMPSPTMASIDGKKFDFKSSLRNPDFLSGKHYESLELKKICPNLYNKKFKVSLSLVVLTRSHFFDRKRQSLARSRSSSTSCQT